MTELTPFVRDALVAGKTRDEIREVLLQASWQEDEISDALSRFADIPFSVPIPRRRASGSAREAFLYLVTFMMLYTAAISFGELVCGFIDTRFPDPVQDGYDYGIVNQNDSIRWLIASLIVSFPTWFFLTRSHLINYAKDPERRASPIRRWLSYLTLFVASCTLLTTTIVLLASALGGEFVGRTVLKSGVVIFIASSIFGFYFWELGRGEKRGKK